MEPVTGQRWPTLAQARDSHILATLAATDWNIAKTARMLGIVVKTLYNRLNAMERAGVVVHEGKTWRLSP